MICVLDKPAKSILESNFTFPHFDKIDFKDNSLKSQTASLYEACNKYGIFYPYIKIYPNHITLKYDYGFRFITFEINKFKIAFTYGIIGDKIFTGYISDTNKQLKALSDFLYFDLNKNNNK
jgi:hypothetical protein